MFISSTVISALVGRMREMKNVEAEFWFPDSANTAAAAHRLIERLVSTAKVFEQAEDDTSTALSRKQRSSVSEEQEVDLEFYNGPSCLLGALSSPAPLLDSEGA